ncbi:MAG: hypothetical protein FWC43_01495 [Planctomycetaceae bacterium]|nr:hypothetical protein [Planctomycetaceae bacterium]
MKTSLKSRLVGILAGCLFAVSSLFAPAHLSSAKAAEPKSIVTFSISSYSAVLEAGKVIADQIGQGDTYGMFQGFLGALPGVDNKKPLGFVLFATDEEFLPVVFLPIGDLSKLTAVFPIIDSLLSQNLEEVSPGKYSFSGPVELILEQKKNWLILYPESHPKLAAADPSVFLNGLDKKYLLAFHLNFENMPKELVLQMVSLGEMMVSMFNPDAASQFATVKEQVELLLNEGKYVLEGMNIDPKTGDISAEVVMEVKPNGTFAEALKYQKDGKTNFIGFYRPEQAAAAIGIGIIPDAQKESQANIVKKYFASAVEGVEEELEGDELEMVKGILESLEEIAIATIEDGKTDVAMSWKSTGEMFFGGRIAQGKKLNDVFKKIAAGISATVTDIDVADFLKIEYTTFEGYKFTRLDLPFALMSAFNPNADLPEHLEDKSINLLIGVKNDAICGVIGTDASKLEAILKKCITDSKASAALPKTLFSFSLPRVAGAIQSLDLWPPEPPVVAVLDSLMSAPEGATITAGNEVTVNAQGVKNVMKVNFSGKIIAAVAQAVAAGKEAQMQSALNSDPFDETPETRKREKARDFKF